MHILLCNYLIKININIIAEIICIKPIPKAYNDITFPCFNNNFIFTLSPIAANAITSRLLLITLHICDKLTGIILNENKAQDIKNPITYHGILTFLFLTHCSSTSTISLLDLFFKVPNTNTTTTSNTT